MTFILGLANQQQVILISDRRLSANRQIVEDEANKAATFNLQDARLAVAFTGLAQVPLVLSVPKVGPNKPCPCGSGKKYKKCCGATTKQGKRKSITLSFGRE